MASVPRLSSAFGLILGGLTLAVVPNPPVLADSGRTSPEATVHALDELANAIAQGKVTRTPTPSPTSTGMPTRTPQPVAAPVIEPTATETPQPAPAPCWLTDQDLGDPDNGYVVFDEDGAPRPCPTDVVDLVDATPEPILEPTPTRSPTSTLRSAPQRAAAAPQPAPQAQARPVVETVVVVITATPAPTRAPVVVVVDQAASATTPRPTATQVIPTATPVPLAVVDSTPTPTPPIAPVTAAALEPVRGLDRTWLYASVLACVALAALLVVWRVRRGRRPYAP